LSQQDSTILVVGSINMDLTAYCPHIPAPAETVLGTSFLDSPGGKGANQAVAAARLGGSVGMVGCVGADAYGRSLRRTLLAAKVSDRWVIDRGERSGVALIEVGDTGENSIVVIPGANALLTPADVEKAFDASPEARVVLLQLEVPLRTVEVAARLGHARGLTVMLDPAPARPLTDSLLANVDILLPNQPEAAMLSGLSVRDKASAQGAARVLLERGPRAVVVKLGAQGALLATSSGSLYLPGWDMCTVDTTAAGDCLAGGIATALVQGKLLAEAFGNLAAALSTTRAGAQHSLPTLDELNAWRAGLPVQANWYG
jgi:ribokinase